MNIELKNIDKIDDKSDDGRLTSEQTQEFIDMSLQQLPHLKEEAQ